MPSPRSLRRHLVLLLSSTSILAVGCVAAPPAPTTTTAVPLSTTVVVRPMTFPVSGGATYTDSFGAPRSGGRQHQGQDLMGAKGTALVAVVSGVVTRVRHDVSGLSGNSLTLEGDDGWTYTYIHINNDSPGTDDGTNPFQYAFAPGMVAGKRVAAGDHVAYLGDSGNAETTAAHLHFEIHDPAGVVVNAYPSLKAATTAPAVPSAW